MLKYNCTACKVDFDIWSAQCFECGSFNSLVAKYLGENRNSFVRLIESSRGNTRFASCDYMSLEDAEDANEERARTLPGVDKVLGGGLVKASVVLLAGDPGIGKSTLILHMLDALTTDGVKVFYASGEETISQIKMRAKRLNVNTSSIIAAKESNLDLIISTAHDLGTNVLVLDSIQTVYRENIVGTPGSVNQVRAVASRLVEWGKDSGMTIVLIGHVNKNDEIAGPKTLEHLVDACLYFELVDEENKGGPRRLYSMGKNRFGKTGIDAFFAMEETGLVEINQPETLMHKGSKERRA